MAISALPPVPLRSDAPDVFITKADAFMAALALFRTEANAVAEAMNLGAVTANSTDTLTIGTGLMSLTVDVGKSYVPGMTVKVASTANGVNWMLGDVISYNSVFGTLTVNVSVISGVGVDLSAWTISQAAPGGAAINGSSNQDFAVRTLRQQLGIDIASAATIDLDMASGDTVDVTGTAAISAITLTAGNVKTVQHTGSQLLTHSASMILPGGGNIITQSGDYSVWVGYPSGVVRCVAFNRAGGNDDIGIIQAYAGNAVPAGYIACPNAVSLSLSPAAYPVLFNRIGYLWSNGATSGNFSPPWVPGGYALVAGGTVGVGTVGAIIAHAHTIDISSGVNYAGGGVVGNQTYPGGSTYTSTIGGAANYAAAKNIKFIVRYK